MSRTKEEIFQLILDRIPTYFNDHNTLWRICGSPQDTESYFFDIGLGKLADEGKIQRRPGPNGLLYAKGEGFT